MVVQAINKSKIVLITIVFVFIPMLIAGAADETLIYVYDQNLQLTRVQYGDGTVVEYVYDNVGNRLSATITSGTPVNQPPNAPANPTIANGATNVSTTPTLGWTGSDPDAGDDVLYVIAFGPAGQLAVVASGAAASYQPRQLQALTQYCWQITARDTHNAETAGPTWCFTTRNDPPVADFTATPATDVAPLQVVFTDTSTSADDKLVSWAWDIDNNGSIDSTKQDFSYTYATPGNYTVKLTVTDEHGSAHTKTAANAVIVQAYGSISGTVTNAATGQPVQGMHVFVNTGPDAYTDASGKYMITKLKPGTYTVNTYDRTFGYVDEYYNNQPNQSSATPVTVNSGANTPNINFALAPPGSLSGRVTNTTTGTGIASAWVRLSYGASWKEFAYTDNSGYYTIPKLKPGQYTVYTSYTAGYTDEYYNNATSSTATLVSVTSGGNTPNINFTLTPATTTFGSLAGRVTNEKTGLGIKGVVLYVSNGPSSGNAKTDAAGRYAISNLTPGQYKVYTYYTDGYTDEYYNNATSSTATLVKVNASANTPNINFALTPKGTLSGTVINQTTGVKLQGVTVNVSNGPSSGNAKTDAFGNYTITNLLPGQYKVYTDSASGYVNEYYNNVTSSAAATLVTLTAGTNTPNINFALVPPGSISGKVRKEGTGQGIKDIRVFVSGGPSSGSTYTDEIGNYAVTNLEPGTYKVYTFNSFGYVDEYYNNKSNESSATPITVTAGVNTSNINFALTPTGAISGMVTDEQSGLGVEDVAVYVSNGPSSGRTGTDESGFYTISNLHPGQYKIYTYRAPGYLDEYYNNATSATATLVTVSSGVTTLNIHFALTRAQEMNIKRGTNIIPSGTGNYNYGSASVGGSISTTFTIVNAGNANLNLTGTPNKVTISGTNATDFGVTQQPTSPVAPGGSTTFIVRFAPTANGTRTAKISIANNDSDENPYTFTVTGSSGNFYLLWTK